MLTIAIDAMGGDSAPEAVVEGAAQASQNADARLILVGDPVAIRRILAAHPHVESRIEIVPAVDFIRMDEKPQEALEKHPDASLIVALRLLAAGQADALVTAGNTGAVILACARQLERIPGIRRTALAAVYPTERRHGPHGDPFALMLDVGATLEATAEDLVNFALMGSAYAQVISRNPRPRVALLSNGEEEMKGSPEIVAAHRLLKNHPAMNFIGNVEGVDIPRGTADVIVCNGFIGNVVLKMLEGVAEVVTELARYAMERSIIWKLGLLLLSRGIKRVMALVDWKAYGGAPLLGFNRVVIKAHGRSNPRAIRNAIRVATKAVRGELCQKIAEGIANRPVEKPPSP